MAKLISSSGKPVHKGLGTGAVVLVLGAVAVTGMASHGFQAFGINKGVPALAETTHQELFTTGETLPLTPAISGSFKPLGTVSGSFAQPEQLEGNVAELRFVPLSGAELDGLLAASDMLNDYIFSVLQAHDSLAELDLDQTRADMMPLVNGIGLTGTDAENYITEKLNQMGEVWQIHGPTSSLQRLNTLWGQSEVDESLDDSDYPLNWELQRVSGIMEVYGVSEQAAFILSQIDFHRDSDFRNYTSVIVEW